MNQRIYFTNLIYLQDGQEGLFQEYERRALPIIFKYGGRFENIIKPTKVTGNLSLPDEIHILSFETEADFQRYRQDPESQKIAPLRHKSVKEAIIIGGASTLT